MRSRYRIEMYDEIKSNDLTIYSDQNIEREELSKILFSNLKNFSGNARAYVYDQIKKKKTSAAFYPMEFKNFIK